MNATSLLRSIRIWLGVVIVGLVLSGVTAFPLQHELAFVVCVTARVHLAQHAPALSAWLQRVLAALTDTDARYPFLAYGTDWLAFAHRGVYWTLSRPSAEQVVHRLGIDLLCGSDSAGAYCRTIARDSVLLAVYRLQLRRFCCGALLILKRWVGMLERLQDA